MPYAALLMPSRELLIEVAGFGRTPLELRFVVNEEVKAVLNVLWRQGNDTRNRRAVNEVRARGREVLVSVPTLNLYNTPLDEAVKICLPRTGDGPVQPAPVRELPGCVRLFSSWSRIFIYRSTMGFYLALQQQPVLIQYPDQWQNVTVEIWRVTKQDSRIILRLECVVVSDADARKPVPQALDRQTTSAGLEAAEIEAAAIKSTTKKRSGKRKRGPAQGSDNDGEEQQEHTIEEEKHAVSDGRDTRFPSQHLKHFPSPFYTPQPPNMHPPRTSLEALGVDWEAILHGVHRTPARSLDEFLQPQTRGVRVGHRYQAVLPDRLLPKPPRPSGPPMADPRAGHAVWLPGHLSPQRVDKFLKEVEEYFLEYSSVNQRPAMAPAAPGPWQTPAELLDRHKLLQRDLGVEYCPQRSLYLLLRCGFDDQLAAELLHPTPAELPVAPKKLFEVRAKDKDLELCFICGDAGNLLICDVAGCGQTFHLDCVGLDTVPPGEWRCPLHVCHVCGQAFTAQEPRTMSCRMCAHSFCGVHVPTSVKGTTQGLCERCQRLEALMASTKRKGRKR